MIRFLLALLCVGTPAFAHDHSTDPGAWIGQQRLLDPTSGEWCCDQRDCFPEQVTEFSDFVVVMTGEMIPSVRVIWRSADGRWWRCRYGVGHVSAGKTRCLIGPVKGM